MVVSCSEWGMNRVFNMHRVFGHETVFSIKAEYQAIQLAEYLVRANTTIFNQSCAYNLFSVQLFMQPTIIYKSLDKSVMKI